MIAFLKTSAFLAAALGAFALAAPAVADPEPMAKAFPHDAAMRRPGRETIDGRIAHLHAALQITPTEEPAWAKVAETMRWNAAAMKKLVATHEAEPKASRTALDDLKTYEAFNRAHLEGLKDLVTSFEALYVDMPDTQKAVADHVFARFSRAGFASKS